jgi:hypothetical protein
MNLTSPFEPSKKNGIQRLPDILSFEFLETPLAEKIEEKIQNTLILRVPVLKKNLFVFFSLYR